MEKAVAMQTFGLSVFGRLSNVSLQLPASQITAVIGPNGAGKSTLTQCLSGDHVSANSSIELAGRRLDTWTLQDKARCMASLPQFSALAFPYEVREVVALGRAPHKSGHDIDESVVEAAMAAMDVTGMEDRLYTTLSGGERQRTQLARVLAQIWRKQDAQTRLLILDEPHAALDLAHQKALNGVLRDLAKTGLGVLLTAHDLNIAANIADAVVALKNGECIACGTPAEVFERSILESLYDTELEVFTNPSTHTPAVMLR